MSHHTITCASTLPGGRFPCDCPAGSAPRKDDPNLALQADRERWVGSPNHDAATAKPRHKLGCPQLFGTAKNAQCTCHVPLGQHAMQAERERLRANNQTVVAEFEPKGMHDLRQKAPPVGLRPRSCVAAGECADARMAEIAEAIHRYAKEGKDVPNDWLFELGEMNAQLATFNGYRGRTE